MKSLKIQILTTLFSLLIPGAPAWASGTAVLSPCPARPAIASELDEGKYAQTISVLQQKVERDPNDAQAILWLARSFLGLADYDRAVLYAERAVHLSTDCSESHYWLARSYAMKADTARSFWLARKARMEYEAAVRLDADNLEARRDLMEFYLQAPWILGGNREKAWAQVEAITSRSATEGDLARAIYWRDLNQPELASKEYRKVLEAKPRQAEAYFQVADFYEADGQPSELEAAVQAVSVIAPRDPRLDYYRAVASVMRRRDLSSAEQNLKGYLAKTPPRDDFPSHAAALNWLGRIYEIRGDKQAAIERYRSALDLSPDNQSARDALRRLASN